MPFGTEPSPLGVLCSSSSFGSSIFAHGPSRLVLDGSVTKSSWHPVHQVCCLDPPCCKRTEFPSPGSGVADEDSPTGHHGSIASTVMRLGRENSGTTWEELVEGRITRAKYVSAPDRKRAKRSGRAQASLSRKSHDASKVASRATRSKSWSTRSAGVNGERRTSFSKTFLELRVRLRHRHRLHQEFHYGLHHRHHHTWSEAQMCASGGASGGEPGGAVMRSVVRVVVMSRLHPG